MMHGAALPAGTKQRGRGSPSASPPPMFLSSARPSEGRRQYSSDHGADYEHRHDRKHGQGSHQLFASPRPSFSVAAPAPTRAAWLATSAVTHFAYPFLAATLPVFWDFLPLQVQPQPQPVPPQQPLPSALALTPATLLAFVPQQPQPQPAPPQQPLPSVSVTFLALLPQQPFPSVLVLTPAIVLVFVPQQSQPQPVPPQQPEASASDTLSSLNGVPATAFLSPQCHPKQPNIRNGPSLTPDCAPGIRYVRSAHTSDECHTVASWERSDLVSA